MHPILLVEDDPFVSWITLHLLQSVISHPVLTAEDGRTALECVAATPLAAIILDMELPDISGMTVLKTLRQSTLINALTPVAIISANEIDEASRWMHSGFISDVARKPIAQSRLAQLLFRCGLSCRTLSDGPECARLHHGLSSKRDGAGSRHN